MVGVASPHVAIGTSAIAVAANAAANLATHARAGNVKWRCAAVFSIFGIIGAFAGSTLGKMMDGQRLLALFAVLMLGVGGPMLKGRGGVGEPTVVLSRENFPKLVGLGLATGALSGFSASAAAFSSCPRSCSRRACRCCTRSAPRSWPSPRSA